MRRKTGEMRGRCCSEAGVRRRQLGRLRCYLREVVLPFSAHYGQVFRARGMTADSIRSWEDWRRVPLTSKADLLPAAGGPDRSRDFLILPDEHRLARRPSTVWRALLRGTDSVRAGFGREFRPIFLTSTTGRSAEPLPVLYTRHDLDRLGLAARRLFEICGARIEDRLLNLFPYAPHLAFWLGYYGGTEFGVLTLSSGGGKVMGTEGQLRLIRRLKPDVLIGMPTFVYHILHHAMEAGVRCDHLRRIVLGGEKVPGGLRRKLVDLAGRLGARNVDVVAVYGLTEAKSAWAECPVAPGTPPSGYHLFPDQGFFEVIDPESGVPMPNGEPGELVFTPLDMRGTVVLRYRTGDLIEGGITYEPCPHCGRSLPRLIGAISRRSEIRELRFDKVKGTLVNFNRLEHLLDDSDEIGGWQIELRKLNDDPFEVDELVLHVQPVGTAGRGELAGRLRERVAAECEVRPNHIVFYTPEGIRKRQRLGQELKEERIADNRPKAPGTGLVSSEAKRVASPASAVQTESVEAVRS